MEQNIEYTWSDKPIDMPDTAIVKIKMFGSHADTKTSMSNPTGIEALTSRKRISGTQYVDGNGEIHDYDYSRESRSITSVKDSIKKIREYIEYNFADFECWHITLTYAEQNFDFAKTAHDFDLFIDRLKTRYKQYSLQYLRIIEPHANGAWHIHILVKSAACEEQLRLSETDTTKIWGKGNATARQVANINELVTYFGTVHSSIKNDGHKLSKTEIKQQRWHYYPKGGNIFAKSNSIVPPPDGTTTKAELSKYLSEHNYNTESSKQSSLFVSDTETGVIYNQINYQRFDKNADL